MDTLAEIFAEMHGDWDNTFYHPEEFEELVDVVLDSMEDGLELFHTVHEVRKFDGGERSNGRYFEIAKTAFNWYVASNNPYK